ncbi:uncharacterized protein B0H18DRAFT_1117296 [Fomitopsis serialis]|uniref:uncharacterized protein n=1 Tax=Fomitopsis serialis TaxID=139415 RepID=UPI002007D219|nr:uncharacterized protein B0H18DRAFT_1117296 [Neoantrodia serialis]KAH9929747.1 hypothetical protein B0H18DRAFT_1117296 [Neoantrodia serialis]
MANSLRPQPPLPKRNVFVAILLAIPLLVSGSMATRVFSDEGVSGDGLRSHTVPTSSTAGHSTMITGSGRAKGTTSASSREPNTPPIPASRPRTSFRDRTQLRVHSANHRPSTASAVGGPTKIDSIQNIILLDSSLHDGWDAYEFSIDPDRDYRVTAFINDYIEYDGLHVDFSHTRITACAPSTTSSATTSCRGC